VANGSGVSHGCIHALVSGSTHRVYGTTIEKLRAWYLRQWAAGRDSLTPEVAAYLVEQVLAPLAPGSRNRAAVELVGALERIYDSEGTPRPAWLGRISEECRRSTMGEIDQRGEQHR
jgi:hypothetical protein